MDYLNNAIPCKAFYIYMKFIKIKAATKMFHLATASLTIRFLFQFLSIISLRDL